jgi:hypothetical protein
MMMDDDDTQVRTARRARCQPCAPLLVTAADAAAFPTLWFRPPNPNPTRAAPEAATTPVATKPAAAKAAKAGKAGAVRGAKEVSPKPGLALSLTLVPPQPYVKPALTLAPRLWGG